MSSLWERLRVRWTVLRGRPAPGLRTAKATFAVVAAYLLTAALGVSDHPMVAPLVALLVVQLTLYKTVVHGIGKVVAVLAGVLVAVLVANVAGVTWWSLGAVVAGSLLVGKLLRLGPHLFEAPITAMLLLEVGATGGLGASRVGEAIVGAVVGIGVSVLVAPPLYVQPAGEAIGDSPTGWRTSAGASPRGCAGQGGLGRLPITGCGRPERFARTCCEWIRR
jgi:cell shape-determining protein MreD